MTAVLLCAVAGPIAGQTWRFDQHDTFIFGRAPDCHAQLDPSDSTASRHHFLLEVQPPLVTVRDLGSRNGTYVNGVNIAPRFVSAHAPRGPQLLKDGDEVKVGHTRFVVRLQPLSESADGMHLADLAKVRDATVSDDGESAATKEEQESDSQPGEPLPSVAGFTLVERLGAGGMGKVYRAQDLREHHSNTMIALKILRSRVAEDEANRALFQREIDALTQFDHPRIVKILSSGHQGRTYWFAMELCPNGSLESRATKEQFRGDWKPIVRWMLDALEGLAAAHKKGLVHRDVKPANILIGEDQRAKIADFGLAKSFGRSGLSGLTLSGQFAGTFEFMPREQLTQFKTMLPVSDVYSAAASLHWAVTGKPPIEFTPGQDPLTCVLRGNVVALHTRRPDLPKALCDVVDQCCSRDPSDRYEDAQAFHDALAKVLD